ncbi:hypothetical protein NUU61_009369 [Penicillium alfredii]|uniref:PNPLA domain-containing protein n=1 Tax=Penicillium alfredii TaxID=1506179 RepID=A0A9W9EN53_9EURO|nr:uncharacterized protein NUU61_009369 [Penicillium alfredii]KAJ5084790.1 hypothetical protein NUU61_009369 [Penicillium alfredii]
MQHMRDISWLDIGLREDSRLAVLDHGRLQQVVAELPDPDDQYPALCVFLGGKVKNHALQQLYPLNNIKRHAAGAHIQLRYDIASLKCDQPIFFADGDIVLAEQSCPTKRFEAGMGYPAPWDCRSAGTMLLLLWSRLIFLFADVICIFIDDLPDLEKVVDFLGSCARLRSASSFSPSVFPRVIFVFGAENSKQERDIPDMALLYRKIRERGCSSLSEVFSGIQSIHLADDRLSVTASYERMKTLIAGQLDIMCTVRQEHLGRPNGTQLAALFQSAFWHMLTNTDQAFDVVRATRKDRPVSLCIQDNLAHYLEAGSRADLHPQELAPSIASAILMDHYVPNMLASKPCVVFRTLYRPAILQGYFRSKALWTDQWPEEQTDLVERHFSTFFDRLSQTERSSMHIREEQLMSQSGRLCRVRSNHICLYCLFRTAQHILACGHALCDRCAQIFGTPTTGLECQFTLKGCLCCLYQRPLIVDILPPSVSPTVLAIDGGGVRGVIPLEFLLLVQEHLRPCAIQDVVDLTLGTSSGGLIALGLCVMTWDVAACSKIFENLARRIFHERRHSTLAYLLRHIYGYRPIFGEVARWIQWFLHDSCYDARVFDTALKGVFGEKRCIFGPSRDDPRGPLRSGPKVGVVTTSISRDTGTFVIGNFNAAHDSCGEQSKLVLSTLFAIYRVARATAAAPFFFTPADLPGIGSFQDGGLKYNFAGEIANQVSRQIWPQGVGSIRSLSLGTGIAPALTNQTPHFRHIFRDSFVRRGFDAWMSTMETDSDWKKWKGQLKTSTSQDCHRLDVPLGNTSNMIDGVGAMEDYRNLVILQPGSARMAREAAVMLLISRFHFVLGDLPENTATPFGVADPYAVEGRLGM